MSSPPAFLCFHPTMETWYSYINQFECFLDTADLADISNHRKKAYFLSFCEAVVFDTATALLVPQSVKEYAYGGSPNCSIAISERPQTSKMSASKGGSHFKNGQAETAVRATKEVLGQLEGED
ncbi:hypothetical protein E2320_008852 [Naja naja]|nr:hypothetical protein E2320_008852 [Naja naja]